MNGITDRSSARNNFVNFKVILLELRIVIESGSFIGNDPVFDPVFDTHSKMIFLVDNHLLTFCYKLPLEKI